MIILDTNVVFALMAPSRNPTVVEWLDRQAETDIWTTSVTVMESRYGLGLLPEGRRKTELDAAFSALLHEDLEDRVLAFDRLAADHAAAIALDLKRGGQTLDFRDVQIAAIAFSRRATVATRNVRHFAHSGVNLVNPWVDP
ncbi:MAG: type II toxin-antitoxin system VapC family toxin [Phyllobacteriaceae bacterium]|nr:type II toxin-antitoxin system VapC family toxin [Phyllobacteriaceae bacterium]